MGKTEAWRGVPAALVEKEYNEWEGVVFPEALYVKVVPENQPGEEAEGHELLDVSLLPTIASGRTLEPEMNFGEAGGTWNEAHTVFTPHSRWRREKIS